MGEKTTSSQMCQTLRHCRHPPLSILFGLCCAPHNKPNKIDSATVVVKKNKIDID